MPTSIYVDIYRNRRDDKRIIMQTYTGPVASQEQIEAAVKAHQNHTRFRDLLNPSHPDYNPNYNGLIISIATGVPLEEIIPPPKPPPINPIKQSLTDVLKGNNNPGREAFLKLHRNRKIAESCLYRQQDGCGCSNVVRCFAHMGNSGLANTYSTPEHCAECMRTAWNLAK